MEETESSFQIVKVSFCQGGDRERAGRWETEGELWSVSSLTGMTFLFLFAWQEAIVTGFSHWLMHITPIKEHRLDFFVSVKTAGYGAG